MHLYILKPGSQAPRSQALQPQQRIVWTYAPYALCRCMSATSTVKGRRALSRLDRMRDYMCVFVCIRKYLCHVQPAKRDPYLSSH